MLSKFKEKLTIFYLKRSFGKFEKKIRYKYQNYEHDVFLFSSNKSKIWGNATPFNTILMQDILFKEYSKKVRDYVFLHEMGHVKFNYLLQLIFFILKIPLYPAFFSLIPLMILLPLFLWIVGSPLYFVIGAFSAYLIIFFIISFILFILNWIEEGYAEIFAIKIIGENNYISAREELKQKSTRKNILRRYFNRIRYRFHYPPEKLVLWGYRKMQ